MNSRPSTSSAAPASPAASASHAGGGEESGAAPDLRTVPLQEKIAASARQLWEGYGRPSDRDLDIWLEAERQVLGTDPEVSQVGGPSAADLLNQSAPAASTAHPGGASPSSGEPETDSGRGVSPAGASAGSHSNPRIKTG